MYHPFSSHLLAKPGGVDVVPDGVLPVQPAHVVHDLVVKV